MEAHRYLKFFFDNLSIEGHLDWNAVYCGDNDHMAVHRNLLTTARFPPLKNSHFAKLAALLVLEKICAMQLC